MKVVSLENLSKYNELLNQKTVRSVNSVKPDSNGNVQLGTEKSTFNKVVYDTDYFSVGTDKSYSFDLTGSDLENVSKENINIRLIAKVTKAYGGFKVGDIAQLTPSIDTAPVDWGIIDVCSYISGNTLYIYSGSSDGFSIHSGTDYLRKPNVQIKAVLTAFIPDDGSILLIAEDQTNTSKLIGLSDGTLTWKDKNILTLEETWTSGTSGYRVYSDGFCEQWGRIYRKASGNQVTFAKPYKDTNYSISHTQGNGDTDYDGGTDVVRDRSLTTTGFIVDRYGSEVHSYWHTWGYIR